MSNGTANTYYRLIINFGDGDRLTSVLIPNPSPLIEMAQFIIDQKFPGVNMTWLIARKSSVTSAAH